MRHGHHVSAAALLAAACGAAVAATTTDEAALARHADRLDAAGDRIVHRAFVPDAADPHGEVRLLRRGDTIVFQTALASRVLRRVVGRIADKELAAWPPEHADRAGAITYIDALRRAHDAAWARFEERADRDDRRQRLVIEHVLAPEAAFVAFLHADVELGTAGATVGERETLFVIEPSRSYVERAVHLIAADAFGMEMEEAEELIATASR